METDASCHFVGCLEQEARSQRFPVPASTKEPAAVAWSGPRVWLLRNHMPYGVNVLIGKT